MSIFGQQLNPMTGRLEWGLMADDYDYKQEVARSAYADMLHDEERNNKYYEGVRRAVGVLRGLGAEVRVLDIGAGTGLLSMMAAACGADQVTACEAFYPMAECARKGLAENGFADKVRLIPKRSTELTVGPGCDMEARANLLVAELLDTELIGEGAIDTYRHARDFLLTEDAILVPSEGVVYAQVVSSERLQRWNTLAPLLRPTGGAGGAAGGGGGGEVMVPVPVPWKQCPGAAAVHDLQLSQVPRDWFTPLSHPMAVFRFDWSGRRRDLPTSEVTKVTFESLGSGSCDAVLMWWDVTMDPQGEVTLSCAPYWAHPDLEGAHDTSGSEDIPWRDHWMQAVYYLPSCQSLTPGENVTLVSAHDEYSLWFDVQTARREDVCVDRPVCTCGVHIINSRTRIGQLNDPIRRRTYLSALQEVIDGNSVVLALGDGCLMGLAAAAMGARHVYLQEGTEAGQRVMGQLIEANRMKGRVSLLPKDPIKTTLDDLVAPITTIFSEPHFNTTLLPWHNLHHWYLRGQHHHLLAPRVKILPRGLTLWGLPVHYRDLWKIRAPLGTCCGFTMGVFDKLIQGAMAEADDPVEPHPLWEYTTYALGDPIQLLSLDLTSSIPSRPITLSGTSPLTPLPRGKFPQGKFPQGKFPQVNGMALWVDWEVTEGNVLSTGPTEPVTLGERVTWDTYTRQGVYFFPCPHSRGDRDAAVRHTTTFNPRDGTMVFDFKVVEVTGGGDENGGGDEDGGGGDVDV